MKNFLKSVLFALLIGLIYLGMLVFIITPLLFLFKEGFIGLMVGNVNILSFISSVLGQIKGNFYRIDAYSLGIIITQIVIFLATCGVSFWFFNRVLKDLLTGDGESYFRIFYEAIYLVFLFVPEILVFMSLFFKFPVIRTIIIIGIILFLVFILALIITLKVLPDVIKNRDSKFMLEEDDYE